MFVGYKRFHIIVSIELVYIAPLTNSFFIFVNELVSISNFTLSYINFPDCSLAPDSFRSKTDDAVVDWNINNPGIRFKYQINEKISICSSQFYNKAVNAMNS